MRLKSLEELYLEYVNCLNDKKLHQLNLYVHDNVVYNGEKIGAEVIVIC